MNNNLEFENEDPSPDSIEDNHPRTNYGEGYGGKETLEEAAERLYPKYISDPYNPSEDLLEEERNIFIEGTKWQSERMYSEEEVFNLCREFAIFVQRNGPSYKKQQEWFEQFKRKA